MSKAKKSLSPG